MRLRFLGTIPDTGKGDSPTIWLDEDAYAENEAPCGSPSGLSHARERRSAAPGSAAPCVAGRGFPVP